MALNKASVGVSGSGTAGDDDDEVHKAYFAMHTLNLNCEVNFALEC